MKEIITTVTIAAMLLSSSIPLSNVDLAFAQSNIRIEGSGATFAFPLLDLWRVKYQEVNPDVTLNYQSIGSGGGVRNHIEMLSQFGATEAPLTDAEIDHAPGTVTIPALIGAVAVAYNIEGVPNGLDITEEALCGIFLGEITSWDDPAIADYNPNMRLPDAAITTAHRSDGSGTTFAFTTYLSKVCPEWDERIGAAKSVPWPTGRGSPGNEGVATAIRDNPNSIGYITLAYALTNQISTADIQNGDHTGFVYPSVETSNAAAEYAAYWLPAATDSWKDVDLLAASGPDSYPITSFSYIIVHPDLADNTDNKEMAQAVIDIIAWMITDGQQYSSGLGYVPISDLVANIGLKGLETITYNGESLNLETTNVWASDIWSERIDASIDNAYVSYAVGDMDQSTFLNVITQMLQLHDQFKQDLLTESEIEKAMANILS